MIKKYIEKIVDSNDSHKMEYLSDMLEELVYNLKDTQQEEYTKYKTELYELAYGKKISEEIAHKWVNEMKPVGEHWTIEQTTAAKQSLGYNLDDIDFYVVANMMYNDYNNLVSENEGLALKLANDWLNDEDAKENKLYCYWKYVIKR